MAISEKVADKEIRIGDTVLVKHLVKEADKARTQNFEGTVISIKGRGESKSFTVRRISSGGIGVERIWPAKSPLLKNIDVIKRGKTRRAKLYYLRKKTGKKSSKIKEQTDKKSEKKKTGKKR